MIINHNMASLNTYRQMGANNFQTSKSLEKLSSGLRINRAGDDAAGLAISEKMRGQIRGLDQAARNSQDGISLIQTAEGNLSETHAILQRMRELAVQSSNGTNKNEVDRENINEEVQRLKEEVDRIADATSFNGIKLLDGSLSKDGSMKVGGSILGKATVIGGLNTVTGTDFTISGATSDKGLAGVSITGAKTSALNDVNFRFQLGSKDQDPTAFVDSDKNEIVITLSAKEASNSDANLQKAIGNAVKGSNLVYESATTAGEFYYKSTGDKFVAAGTDFSFKGFDDLTKATDGVIVESDVAELNTSLTKQNGAAAVTAQQGFAQKFQIGTDVGNTLEIKFTKMDDPSTKKGINDLLNGYTFKFVANDKSYIQASVDDDKKVITVGLSTVRSLNTDENIKSSLKGLKVNGYNLDDSNIAFTVTGTGDLDKAKKTGFDTKGLVNVDTIAKDGLTFQIGADAAAEQRVKLNIEDMSTDGLKINAVSMATPKGSSDAITTISNAINTVAKQRSNLGALQNRLEHTITNLGTSSENLTAAESRIRDVDMAKEMMQFQKNNILSQAAQAMMAQANQQPQGVLQLLR